MRFLLLLACASCVSAPPRAQHPPIVRRVEPAPTVCAAPGLELLVEPDLPEYRCTTHEEIVSRPDGKTMHVRMPEPDNCGGPKLGVVLVNCTTERVFVHTVGFFLAEEGSPVTDFLEEPIAPGAAWRSGAIDLGPIGHGSVRARVVVRRGEGLPEALSSSPVHVRGVFVHVVDDLR